MEKNKQINMANTLDKYQCSYADIINDDNCSITAIT